MKLSKAIGNLNRVHEGSRWTITPELFEAIKLSIEALEWRERILKILKRCQGSETSLMGDRAYWLSKEDLEALFAPLPGETEIGR